MPRGATSDLCLSQWPFTAATHAGIWSGDNRRALELARDVRQLLISHFAGREEITQPLSQALGRILEALSKPAAESSPATPPRRSLLSRLRASISRLLPPPRIK
ncbi:MAG: hypothetical protein K2M05_04870 [Paramuribaculum sp.]|nr:hypothetical protein [Paramuribaculum sp.]